MERIITMTALALTITISASPVFARLNQWYSNQTNTYGWQLMSPEEQKAHHANMRRFTEYSDCKGYIDEHDKNMKDRTLEKGFELPVIQQNPCETMKNRRMLK